MKGRRSLRWAGLLVGLAILLIPVLTTARPAPAQANESAPIPLASPVGPPQGEDGSITITARMCPEGYAGDAYDADCVGVPRAGTEFSIFRRDGSGESVDIDGHGVAVLPLPATDTPGRVRLSGEVAGPLHDVNAVVSCVDDGGKKVPVGNTEHRIAITVTADGKTISCAWYFIPDWIDPGDPATVTFVNLLCPPGYKGENYAADCVTSAGEGMYFVVAVQLPGGDRVGVTDYTGLDGVVTIPIPSADVVLPGTIFLGQWVCVKCGELPEDLDPFVATCTRNEGAEAVPGRDNGPNGIAVDALVDDAITCLWYSLPPPA
ncbi:MAG: hypothetical protein ACRDJH_14965 [Thermomicrobiales bacterium]